MNFFSKTYTHKASKYLFLIIIFISGFCIFSIETLSVRILTPYFGSTIYNYSSVITVVLITLSIGYFVGGTLADKIKSNKLIYLILFFCGICIYLSYFAILTILPLLGNTLSISLGPLMVSILLYSIPTLLLGMIYPLVLVRYTQSYPDERLGHITSVLNLNSTIGGVSGCLITAFILIPNFNTSILYFANGSILISISAIYFLRKKLFSKLTSICLIILLVIVNFLVFIFKFETYDIIYMTEGTYEKITVKNAMLNSRNAKILYLDKSRSSAIFNDSDDLVFNYSKYYKIYSNFDISLNNVLVIGGGSYTIPQKYIQENQNVIVNVAEIEPKLLSIAKKHFKFDETNPRFINNVDDGRHFLNSTKYNFDVIYSDVFNATYSVPINMATLEFYNLSKSKLTQNGIFISNVLGNLKYNGSSFLYSLIKTFKQTFPNSYFYAVNDKNKSGLQNIIFVGLKSESKMSLKKSYINYPNEVINLSDHQIDISKINFNDQLIFTDDFNPIEYLITKDL